MPITSTKKISRACGILSKLRHFCSLKLLKMVYYAIVYSHLQYCNVTWGNASTATLLPLQCTMNKIMRIISFAPFNSSNIASLYKNFGLLQLSQIHELELGKLMFKHKNKMLPERFNRHFSSISSVHI